MNKENRPQRLYKYREANQFALRLLREGECYFPSPSSLNDPFEVSPRLRYDPKGKNTKAHVSELLRVHKPGLKPAERLREAERIRRQHSRPIDAIQLDSLGVLSLTEDALNPLMWAHYADNHKGICVEFDANKWLFRLAAEVKYQKELPVLDTANDEPTDMYEKICLTKADYWSYEREWRVISGGGMRSRDPMARKYYEQMRGVGVHILSDSPIVSVIFGLRCDPKFVDKVRRIRDSLSADWVFSKIQKSGCEYRLLKKEL